MKEKVKVDNIEKFTTKKRVVTPLSFTVHEGEIFVLAGPEGSGKTLVAKMMINLVRKSGGRIKLSGRIHTDTLYNTSDVGYVLWEQTFEPKHSAHQALDISAKLSGNPVTNKRIKNVLDLMGLTSLGKIPVERFGAQEISRLKIACALVTKPKILVMDSPFDQLSHEDAVAVRIILKTLADNLGTAIVITSPTLAGVEEICDTVGIIANGVVISVKSYNEMVKPLDAQAKIGVFTTNPTGASKIIERELKFTTQLAGDKVIVNTPPSNAEKIYDFLVKNGITVIKMEKVHASIQEEYFKIMQGRGGSIL